jgi:hypothetical protein
MHIQFDTGRNSLEQGGIMLHPGATLRGFLGVCFLSLAVATLGHAQGSASLGGTVYDPSRAVVPGVDVTAVHVATNVVYTTQTTAAGLYRFPSLPVGAYKVSVKATGFRTVEITNVILTVGETTTQDITLEVGAVTQVVTVEGAGVQLVSPSETKVSGLIDATTLSMLPLEVREPSAFVNLMPGTVDGGAITSAIGTVSRGPSVHGSRSGTGNFTVDGYDNNDQGQGGRGGSGSVFDAPGAQVGISPDALQEFRVVTSNFEADQGRAGGFVADVTLKSGSNSLHGSLFEYNRVQKLAANHWASNKGDIKDSLVRNQFGGSIGGPIKKDKAFWFSTIELQRMRTGSPTSVTSVTPDFVDFIRSGQFADFMESSPNGLCNNQSALNNLFDAEGAGVDTDGDDEVDTPLTAAPCPGAFNLSRTLGPMAADLYDTYGLPVPTADLSNAAAGLYTGEAGITYPVNSFGTAFGRDTTSRNQNRMSHKLDFNLSDKDRISGTWLFDDLDSSGSFGGDFFNPAFPFVNPSRFQLYGMTYTRTFTPTVVNEFRISYLRNSADYPEQHSPEPPSIYADIASPLSTGWGLSSSLPQFFTDNQFQYKDDISIVHGKHTFKVGGEYRRTRNGSQFAADKNGEFEYNDVESMLTDGAFGDESDLALFGGFVYGGGLGVASINPTTGQLPEYYRGFRANEVGIYVEDSWKLHPRLTVNLGLRWEYQGPPHNFRPGIDSNFYLGASTTPAAWLTPSSSGAPALCTADGEPLGNVFFPCGSDQFKRVANGIFSVRNRNIWAKDTNNFAPRVGFAWDVRGDQKLVLRFGGGVFYDRIWNNLFENIRFNPPYFAFAGIGSLFDGTPVGPISLPGFFQFPINPNLFATATAASPRHMDENLLLPYTEQFFGGIQYQFASNMALHVTYTSTLGRKLTGLMDLNTYPGRLAGGRTTRPNTAIGADNSRTNAFRSAYHGIEAQLIKRMSNGLQFQANYTFSKAIDEISDAFSSKDSLRPANSLNLKLDRGRADFDVTHRFVTSVYYELPFFKQNRWIGGWATGGYVTLRTGTPFSILCDCDSNADGYFTDRAYYTGTGKVTSLLNYKTSPADGYLQTESSDGNALFAETPLDAGKNQGLWIDGALGRNILNGPGFADVTWTIQKRFRVTEHSSFQFQANFFNMFNHPNFTRPSELIDDPAFGKSTGTFEPRIIQLALRFDF